jgi:hypothetical protein
MQFAQLKRREFSGAAAWPLKSALLSFSIAVSWPASINAHDIYTALKAGLGEAAVARLIAAPHIIV